MSAIGGLLGTSGGINGTGIDGPRFAPITPGTDPNQIATAYGGAQNSLGSQQALLAAIQAQNGLGNQSQVYNQLQGVVNGTGPNPAQAQLAQATGQNVQNQAAMMAGQRGAGANVGLMARQAAMQGAQTQQNSIGQAASLQAQQSLNAMNSAGTLANTQAANQIGATSANTQAQQSEQQILQNANAQGNNANIAMQGNVNAVQGQLANTTMNGQQGMIGGVLGGLGSAMSLAGGGQVPQKFADGGVNLGVEGVDPPAQEPFNLGVNTNLSPAQPLTGPQSSVGQFMNPQAAAPAAAASVPSFSSGSGAQALQQGMTSFLGSGSKTISDLMGKATSAMGGGGGGSGGGAGGMLSLLAMAAQGGTVGSKLKTGGAVPGKAKVQGNSYSNDNVKALLSPGELVVDRESMQDKGAVGQAARFLAAAIAAKKKGAK